MTHHAYYNEIDPYAAAWLRNLIQRGLIAPGHVDARDIRDIDPAELDGFTQCHFFAGLGGWSRALRLAGVPDSAPLWTGSCPCQPFSAAGQKKGLADERHLWPAFRWHIAKRRPPIVFGEQVASKDGRTWLAGVRDDLEAMGYAVGGADLCAPGAGACNIRQRLYWVALADDRRRHPGSAGQPARAPLRRQGRDGQPQQRGRAGGLADGVPAGWPEGRTCSGHVAIASGGSFSGLADAACGSEHGNRGGWTSGRAELADLCSTGPVGDADGEGPARESLGLLGAGDPAAGGFWGDFELIRCLDDKWRRIEPGSFPLAHGLPLGLGRLSPELRQLAKVAGLSQSSLRAAKSFRVGTLRGYGNAINPEITALFIRAAMEASDS